MKELIAKNPARSRPLSPNVKRLMQQSRMAQQNPAIHKLERPFTARDQMYCHMQGNVFMEAAAMGLGMDDFVPRYMNSQLAGVMDVSFSRAAGMENDELSNLLRIPVLMKNPATIVEILYWIEDIVQRISEDENKSIALARAISSDAPGLPAALAELPEREAPRVADLEYAYWLGYIYRCECLLHEESSRMVCAAFPEKLMRMVYQELMNKELADGALADVAIQICEELDRLLVEKIWKRML